MNKLNSQSEDKKPLVNCGVSLKSDYYDQVLNERPDVGFFEVHAENYMLAGGPHMDKLHAINDHYDISVHGVGLSLGSSDGVNKTHLQRFKKLVDDVNPVLVSEHLSWAVHDGVYLNDLLPLPMTQECLEVVSQNVDSVQQAIGRQILMENPSCYMGFNHDEMTETEFLSQLCERTGCGILLDVNNIYVTGHNLARSVDDYLNGLSSHHIGEVHLAGHSKRDVDGRTILIDDHGATVSDEVWEIYRKTISKFGPKPSLVEWDSGLPEFDVLLGEMYLAENVILDHMMKLMERENA